MRYKKYFKTRREANKYWEATQDCRLHVWKMPKGSRHAGLYAVCTEFEYLNTY